MPAPSLRSMAAVAQAVLTPAALAWAVAAPALADSRAQDMVLGRIVVPRAEAPSITPARSPQGHYLLHCAGCHRMDGSGAPEHYVPDLRRMGQWLRVPGGREYLIGVPGIMGSGLDDAQVAAVTNWLLSTLAGNSVPPGHLPYRAAEVAQTRAQPMTDVAAVRQRLAAQARQGGVAID